MKKQITFRIDEEVIDKIKDIVYANRDMSLNGLIEYTLQAVVDTYGNVPKRPKGLLRAGRKLS